MAARWLAIQTGADVPDFPRPACGLDYAKLIQANGDLVALVRRWAEGAGLAVTDGPARPGDIAVIDHAGRQALAIAAGDGFVARAPDGLAVIFNARCLLVLRP